jgi:hypothetical protein
VSVDVGVLGSSRCPLLQLLQEEFDGDGDVLVQVRTRGLVINICCYTWRSPVLMQQEQWCD